MKSSSAIRGWYRDVSLSQHSPRAIYSEHLSWRVWREESSDASRRWFVNSRYKRLIISQDNTVCLSHITGRRNTRICAIHSISRVRSYTSEQIEYTWKWRISKRRNVFFCYFFLDKLNARYNKTDTFRGASKNVITLTCSYSRCCLAVYSRFRAAVKIYRILRRFYRCSCLADASTLTRERRTINHAVAYNLRINH